MIQVAIFYKKSQKKRQATGAKPSAVIRLSYNSLLSSTTRRCCELEHELKKLDTFAELDLEK